jgi:hypothetical protein
MIRAVCPALLAVAAAALFAVPRDAAGCAAVPHEGERVDIAGESALIVWDEATKTQHFIRRATFQSTAYDFGFLVPTPHRPQLGEVRDDVFARLATVTAPRVETVKRTVFPACGMFMMGSKTELGSEAAPEGVVLLDQGKVGGHDYAMLAFRPGAKDADPAVGAEELAKWLRDRGYPFSPTLAEWLTPYVRDGWIITAFKVAGQPRPTGAGNGGTTGRGGPPATRRDGPRSAQQVNGLQASAVRMSFKADRPYFPYREPADQRDERAAGVSRSLRVYFVAAQRFAGKLGDGSVAWPGRTVWADKLAEAEVKHLADELKLPAGLPSGELWLTEFEDRSSPRPGTDEVYFEPSPDQSTVARPPLVRYVDDPTPWLIGFVVALPVALLGALLILRWASRKQ